MSKKTQILCILTTMIFGVAMFIATSYKTSYADEVEGVYQVYLNGEKIGMIDSQDELYALINEEQSSIKDEYNVDQVYPPKGFSITKLNTYNSSVSSVTDIYDKIKESKSFTIKGYTITVSDKDDNGEAKVLFKINVLDEKVFEDAIKKVILSFIPEDEYLAYINNEQKEIVDVGEKIENIYFQENISIKESYISTDEKIFTDVESLSKYLLFGTDSKESEYTVKVGDTISSIAEANELNVSEFLVANPKYKSENDLLAVGDKVVISLINPMLQLVYDKYIVKDVEEKYSTETKYDYSKDTSYRLVQTKGVNGIRRVASRTQVINGDASQQVVIDKDNTYMVRETVNEVIVKGKKSTTSSSWGNYVDDGTEYAWPTLKPYIITSGFGTRYLFNRTSHDGLDISGTGYGSPIFAIASGTVIWAGRGGYGGSSIGINVVIQHPNGYCSIYGHMSAVYVSKGQQVSRAQKVGAMGKTGLVTGTHLHLGFWTGLPYQKGSKAINPITLYK